MTDEVMTIVDERGEICDEVQKKLEHGEAVEGLIDAARAACGLLLMMADCEGLVITEKNTALCNMTGIQLHLALDKFYEVI